MKKTLAGIVMMYFSCSMMCSYSCSKAPANIQGPIDTVKKDQPAVMGRLIFHSYSCYDCKVSKLYSYDFSTGKLLLLSDGWNIANAMNAHFSADGNKIVFMGEPAGTNNWDVFVWTIGSSVAPKNLTASFGTTRDEDPKFSNQGATIVFKQNGVIKEMDTLGNIIHSFTVPQPEASMPFYAKGDTVILYSGSEATGSTADIDKLSIASALTQPISAIKNLEEYYPIAFDDSSFLFTRWFSLDNQNDQVYRAFLNGSNAERLSFNEANENYSDAYPVNDSLVMLSSTRPGGKGGYDLYIANIKSGKRWSLGLYNPAINSERNELGACYYLHP